MQGLCLKYAEAAPAASGESSQPRFAVWLHAGVTPYPLNCQYERIDSRPAYCARALPHGERDSRG